MIICKKYTCLVCMFNISILSWQEEDKIYTFIWFKEKDSIEIRNARRK